MPLGDPTNHVDAAGHEVSARTWLVINDAWDATPGLAEHGRPQLAQGSWHNGDQSAGTHTGGGAGDVRIVNVPASLREPFVVELRKRNACAWLRDTAHGWTTGDHIHLIVRDEPGLAVSARAQVIAYDRGLDGLARRGPDYHPRPTQYPVEHYTEADMPLTPDDVKAVAQAVWNTQYKDPVAGANASTASLLVRARVDAHTGATRPLAEAPAMSDADVTRIATEVADLLAARLKS